MFRLAAFLLFAVATTLLIGTDALAQDGRGWRGRDDGDREERRDDDERGRDRGRDRGGRDSDDDRGRDGDRGRSRGGRWGGGGNPEDFWKRFDRNEDGMIAPDEVDERFRDRLQIDKPTKIEDLVDRSRRRQEERDGERDSNRRAPTGPSATGFGVAASDNSKVPGFGPPTQVEGNTSGAGQRNTAASQQPADGGSGSGNSTVTSNAYVDGVFSKQDADKNGILEGDELTNARGLPPKADRDEDGKLTRDELIAAVPSKSSQGGKAAKEESAGRRSYRFTTAHERLTGSAKSWIVSRDKNADGQVAMHEFSRTWTDSKVREFQRYDLNGDGVVTAAEYESR